MSKKIWLLVAGLSLCARGALADIAPAEPEPAKPTKPEKKKKKAPKLKPPVTHMVGTEANVDDSPQAPPGNPREPIGQTRRPVGRMPPPQPVGSKVAPEPEGTRQEPPRDEPVGKRAPGPSTESPTVGTHMEVGHTRGREADPTPAKKQKPEKKDDKGKSTYGDAPNP